MMTIFISENIPECRAIQQHRKRIEDFKQRYIWDAKAASQAVLFIEKNIRHWKSPYTGMAFKLSPWQKELIVEPLYGLYKESGERLFREAYIQVPRKNGKTSLASALLLYELCIFGGYGAEVYAAATTAQQSRIVYEDCVQYIRASAQLKRRLTASSKAITYADRAGTFRPLSSEYSTLDGLNVSFAIVDELHQHTSDSLYNVLQTATMSRSNPLICAITTAGDNRSGFCYQRYELAKSILAGEVEDSGLDSFFCFIAEYDSELYKWDSEEAIIQANPNLEISCKLADIKSKLAQAKIQKSQELTYRRYILNEWLGGSSASWLGGELWDACEDIYCENSLQGLPCWGGVDLARSIDLNSFCLVFLCPDGRLKTLWRHWMPKETIQARAAQDRVPFEAWSEDGFLTLTQGNVVDQNQIISDVTHLCKKYNPESVAFDSWNALHIYSSLQAEGIPLVEFVQGTRSYHAPTQETERLITSKNLLHNRNPLVAWCAENVRLELDISGKMRPCKDYKASTKRIDSIVSLIMAVDGYMRSSITQQISYKGITSLDIRSMMGI